MMVFSVTTFTPHNLEEQALVVVTTPSGLVEYRSVHLMRPDALTCDTYAVDLIARMYPGKANKIHGHRVVSSYEGLVAIQTVVVETDD